MERVYSHSKPPAFSSKKKPPPPSSFHHHNNNGGFFSTTTTSYDDVFGGPPKFASSSSLAPRAEDYSEIFGGFRLSSTSSSSRASSSIPVLDLPAVPDDIGAAFFDYSEVFGGFNAVDFAVPFDQLFRPCDDSFIDDDDDDVNGHAGDGDGASSDEAWTPVGTDSLSDDSDPFASSEKSQRFSSVNPHQQSECKQFNVSYHKVNPGTSSYTPNTMHVTQLNDMPGYTCVVDEAISLREIGNESCSPVVDDTQEITRTTWSHASDDNSGLKAYNSDPSAGRPHGASISHMNSTFASISDINLRTKPSHLPPPSRPPPVVSDKSGDISDLSSGPRAAEKCGFEETVDCGLPPFFDMEVDASSFAAASAAAVEDAMEKAQAKMKTAKQSRDRQDRIQNSGKLHLDTDSNGGENIQRPLDESLSGETRVHKSDRGPSKIKNNVKARHTMSTSQNLLNILAVDQLTGVSEKPARTKQEKRNRSSSDNALTDDAGQWKEAQQYYEFVNNDNTQSTPQTHSSEGDAITATMHQGGDDNSDSGGEPCVTGENRRRLKTTKAVSRQAYYEKMVKVAQEVHDGVNCGHVGPDKKLKHMLQGNSRQQKPELVSEPEMLEIPLCRSQEMLGTHGEAVWKEKFGNSSNNVRENEEESEACQSDQADKNKNGIESMVEDTSSVSQGNFSGSYIKDEVDYSVQDTVGRGSEQIAQESHGRLRIGSRLEEASKKKKNKEAREMAYKRSREASEGVFIGDRMQTACGIEEKNANDLQRMKASDKRLEEVLECVSGTETLQTDESPENNMMRNLQQRDGYENHVGEAVEGQGSKRTLEKCNKCEDDKKVPGQEIGRQRPYEDLIVDSKNSDEGEKQDIEDVKPEKATELEHVEHTFLQACVMDKLWCKLEEAVEGQGSKKTLKMSVELENSAKNTEVSEQPIRTERLNAVHDLIVDNKNSEEFQGQDEKKKKLEKTTEPEQESLKGCELRERRKINENIDDKEDNKGLCRSHIKFEWQDKDQVPTSSSSMELPIGDNHVKSSNETKICNDNEHDISCKVTKPQSKANGFRVVTAQKEHNEIGMTSSDEKSKLEPVKSADLLIEKQIESDAAQVVSEDSELEGRTSQSSDTVDLNENNVGSACERTEQTREKEKREVSLLTSDPILGKDNNIEGVRKRNLAEGQILFDQEEKVKSRPAEGIHVYNEHASKEEVTHTVFPEKERFQKTSHLPKVGQIFERKGKDIDHNFSSEDKDGEKERDLEKERLRKLEEERERLREREKDRMAVEMTIREARDRAYADARDRAALERATDEARQRAMTEARERLEKACAEARERSLADREARLRAERAAVERATAEARQRAIEKAMAERTTFEARDRMQRSVSEKYSSEREVIMRQSSFPASNERFETANSEPAERCKARLERHRRTVERVAKALAEKNMRDLVTQREQAERTRLAETLDADIRRWSSGKEGNLRALLSTLQYILGADSGWQPIPLTEVITAAAVKKAYRKATLCVHPDKLQQRGASIQQKYICEKVFDLLKEAWNRFNSEEK